MQTELLVKGKLVLQPDEVRSTWADHFEMLASPQEDDTFDNKFKTHIDDSIEVIKIISKYMAAKSAIPFSMMKSQLQFLGLRGIKLLIWRIWMQSISLWELIVWLQSL